MVDQRSRLRRVVLSDGLELALGEDREKKKLEGEAFARKFREYYDGPKLEMAERLFGTLGNLWQRRNYKSGRPPRPLSVFDNPADNSVLSLMPPLPLRNQHGNVVKVQGQSFRNTRIPDIISREVFPHWEIITSRHR